VSSETTRLLLIRHGATAANERRPYILQGKGIDLPLSPAGERQAAALARFLRQRPVHGVYTSTLYRARQTAHVIAAPHGLAVQPVPGIGECDVGRWEGLSWESIETRDPDHCRRFLEDPSQVAYPGGESYADVLARVKPVFDRLLDVHRGETIAVVAHNIVNRVYVAHLLGIELRRAKELHQQNACINLIVRGPAGTELVTMNSTFHLPEP